MHIFIQALAGRPEIPRISPEFEVNRTNQYGEMA